MALKTLAAYYSRGCDSSDLYKGFKIESDSTFHEYLNQYDVIFLNMQQFLIEADSEQITDYLEREVLRELREEYGQIINRQNIKLASALREILLVLIGYDRENRNKPHSCVIEKLEKP